MNGSNVVRALSHTARLADMRGKLKYHAEAFSLVVVVSTFKDLTEDKGSTSQNRSILTNQSAEMP